MRNVQSPVRSGSEQKRRRNRISANEKQRLQAYVGMLERRRTLSKALIKPSTITALTTIK
jgi:hypothetical protein